MQPFDIINNVTASKENIWPDIDEKDYNSFLINRGLSYFIDTVMLANEINKHPDMPKRWQYEFYHLTIHPKKKRFAKWAKPEDDELLTLISEFYNVNIQRSASIRALLSPESINTLREATFVGGKNNDKNKR